jgi:hypothetical protein
MDSVLYVSQSTLFGEDADDRVRAMVDLARVRNSESLVTGALIYTGRRFAQYLEGPAQSVDAIMSSIKRDTRHERVTVLPTSKFTARRFDRWALSYAGQSTYVDRHLKALFQDLANDERNERIEALIEIMWALNNTQGVA